MTELFENISNDLTVDDTHTAGEGIAGEGGDVSSGDTASRDGGICDDTVPYESTSVALASLASTGSTAASTTFLPSPDETIDLTQYWRTMCAGFYMLERLHANACAIAAILGQLLERCLEQLWKAIRFEARHRRHSAHSKRPVRTCLELSSTIHGLDASLAHKTQYHV